MKRTGNESCPFQKLLSYLIFFFTHCSNTAGTSGDLFFKAFVKNCRSVKVGLDFSVASAAYIQTLMRHFYRKYGLFAAYRTHQMDLSFH
jgi:hypothetical protein